MMHVLRHKSHHVLGLPIVALVLSAAIGCDREPVGSVHGVVTLDGQPLPEATVTFQPDNGRTSFSETDAAGRYALRFNQDEPGATVGRHTVSIGTSRVRLDAQGNPIEVRERVPIRYNHESDLVEEVTAGEQKIDFALRSK